MAKQEQFDFSFRERYLRQRLTPDERAAYEKALDTDPDLVAELRRHIAFSHWAGHSLAAKESTATPRRRRISPLYTHPYPIAAAILVALLVTLALLVWNRNFAAPPPAPDPTQLYAANYTTMPDLITADRREAVSDLSLPDSLSVALAAYRSQNWSTAAAYFTALERDTTVAEDALFYLAMTDLERQRYSQAITHLENYLQRYSIYEADARWYLSLAYLRTGQSTAARRQLERIGSEAPALRQKAKTLLSQLPK